jgi:hypothetical protein
MKIYSQQGEEHEHVITRVEHKEMYKVIISRLNAPYFSIEYDHLSKTGTPLLDNGEKPPPNMKQILEKAVRFGRSQVKFDKNEIQIMKKNGLIQKQYKEYLRSLPKGSTKISIENFLNQEPVSLDIPKEIDDSAFFEM